jgi:hypothetical protein
MSTTSRHFTAATAAALLGLPVAAAVADQGGDGNAASLREKLILSEAAIKGLTESLAVANGETELFKRKSDDLVTRVESLGISPAGKETESLRTRLLASVRDMRLLQQEKDKASEQLLRLSESVMELLKSSKDTDPKSRLKVEEELRNTTKILRDGKDPVADNSPGLGNGTVVEVKPELALVVANLGARQGVKTGMPFQVWRGSKQIASVRVVDVRDAVSGAIVQNTANPEETIKAGDTIRIDTTR